MIAKPGAPFGFLSSMLQLYTSTYGLRAVLWMQGETDTKALIEGTDPNDDNLRKKWSNRVLVDKDRQIITAPFGDGTTIERRRIYTSADYAKKLDGVIATSYSRLGGRRFPWVVAQTSFIGINTVGRTAIPVVEGQEITRLDRSNGDIYQGPYTDDLDATKRIMGDTDWPVHFNESGATTVADRWADKLKLIFCSANPLPPLTPYLLGTEPVEIEISADGQTLTAPDGYAGYKWVSDYGSFDIYAPVAQSQAISTGGGTTYANTAATTNGPAGTFQAVLINSTGLPILTQAINLPYTVIDDTNPPIQPPTTSTGGCYEAESGNRSPGTDVSSGGNASGGQYVGGFDGASRYVDFPVTVSSAGNYPLTFYYSSGESGGYIDYSINGGSAARQNITANGAWNQFIAAPTLTVALNAGANTIRVQGGFRFTLDKICLDGGTPPPTPPTPPGSFALNTPSVNCANGDVTLSVTNQNSNPVEYQASGLRDWGTGNILNVPVHQRTGSGTEFTFKARQTGNGEVSRVFRVVCGGSRIGATVQDSEPTGGLLISPNPGSGRVVVRFGLGAGERATLSVVTLSGVPVQSRAVVGTGQAQEEVLDVSGQAAGLYVVRVAGETAVQTGKLILAR